MEAGLPLLAISILAFCVLLSWQFGGSGLRSRRAVVTTVIDSGLLACWVLLLSFGAFHWAGAIAIGAGFALSMLRSWSRSSGGGYHTFYPAQAVPHNKALQPTSLPPLRVVKDAAEFGRWST